MNTDLENRVIYRSTPGTVRFAWKIVLLSAALSGLIFVLIPLSSKMPEVVEDPVVVRQVPKLIEIPKEEEKVFQEKPPEVKKEQEVKELVEVIQPPTPPPALSVDIEMPVQTTAVKLHVDNNFKPDLDFEVEKIVAVAKKATPIKKIVRTAPVNHSKVNYNSVFAEGQVDEKAVRVKYVPPSYPMRARRRNLSGKVTIESVIDLQGRVTQARILTAEPKGYFEKNCLAVLERLKYKPAMKNGRKVKQRTILTFQFGLQK